MFQIIEKSEYRSSLSLNIKAELNRDIVKPSDKLAKNNADIRHTEVNVLNLEVETLRWQLAQVFLTRKKNNG